MSGKARPSLRSKTLENVRYSNLSNTDKECIYEVFKRYEAIITENDKLQSEVSRLKSLIGEKGQELWSAENQRADKLQTELEQVKRERDAAVDDLTAIGKDDEVCLYCIHNLDAGENGEKCLETDFNCKECNAVCGCRNCQYNSNWQWRGLQGGAEDE